ncbi:MAG: RT0821/Lpp0805 family surface protein [Pseudomonadota bacterium]
MKEKAHHARRRLAAPLLAVALTLALPPVVSADPPPWAPAHGWRKKHDPYYVGYSGTKYPDDYGIFSGRCNREAIGAVLGGAVGAAVGSQIGKGDSRAVATIIGAVLGATVGAAIGRDMDSEDRACFGHTLEFAKRGQTVTWSNPRGVTYAVTPRSDLTNDGRRCREYESAVTIDGRKEKTRGRACDAGDGTWKTV